MIPRTSRSEQDPTLVVRGELDFCAAIGLEAELAVAECAQPSTIVLDLRQLTFIDLRGLDAIVAAHKRGPNAVAWRACWGRRASGAGCSDSPARSE